jgi:hypothetical protein
MLCAPVWDIPDVAIADEGLHLSGAFHLDGFPEPCHVYVEAVQDAAAADAEGGAVGALVYARLPQAALAFDQHPFVDMHCFPAMHVVLDGLGLHCAVNLLCLLLWLPSEGKSVA